MLIGEDGMTLGMLSGGCLESDLVQRARRFRANVDEQADAEVNHGAAVIAETVRYDSRDEDDFLHALGLGCGGVVDILLQPVTADNDYLELDKALQLLESGQAVAYRQLVQPVAESESGSRMSPYRNTSNSTAPATQSGLSSGVNWNYRGPAFELRSQAKLETEPQAKQTLIHSLIPRRVKLGVFGLGADAKPLVRMALDIGWQVTIYDARPGNAINQFVATLTGAAVTAINKRSEQLSSAELDLDAAVVMQHSLELDAQALNRLQQQPLAYCALLVPRHRRDEVVEKAGLTHDQIPWPFFGPAGFDIGAELPETIALSILAECHDTLFVDRA